MANKTSYVNGSTSYNDEDVSQLQTDFFTEGVADTSGSGTDCQVSEKSGTPDMSVDIAAGKVYVDVDWDSRAFKLRVYNLAIANAAVEANSSGSDRVDAALVIVDTSVTPNSAGSNISTFEVLKNTTGSPTAAMSDGDIDTLLGHSDWYRLADITVGNGATSIENADITDTRSLVGFKNNYSVYELDEQSANPSNESNKGKLFSKEVSGRTELHYIDDNGNVVQITDNGSINSSATDEKAKVSNTDTTHDYLENKLADDGILAITTLNPAGNEQLQFSVPESTEPQAQALTDSASAMTPRRTKTAIDYNTSSNKVFLLAGEDFAAGEVGYLDKIPAFADATTARDFGHHADYEKIALQIIGNGTSMSSLDLALKKIASPLENVTVRIETDTSGSPSGTLADANAYATVSGPGLTTSFVDTTVTFAGAFTLTDKTKYHIVVSRSGVTDPTNYYSLGYFGDTADNTRLHTWKSYDGSDWSSTNDEKFYASGGGFYDGLWALASASNSYTCSGQLFIAGEAITAPALGKFNTSGVDENQSSLTVSTDYFLSDTAGAISTSYGTIKKKIGIAVATDKIFLNAVKSTQSLSFRGALIRNAVAYSYMAYGGGSSTSSYSITATFLCAQYGTLKNLFFVSEVAASSDTNQRWIVLKNGSDTEIDKWQESGAYDGEETDGRVSVEPGDKIGIRIYDTTTGDSAGKWAMATLQLETITTQ